MLPVGTEGREADWLRHVRDALENALQDSFDEHEDHPWVIQLYAQDKVSWDNYLDTLERYIHPRAKGTQFTEFYLRHLRHHLQAISKPGGLFTDNTVTHLPRRGQTRRVRLVIYRRVAGTVSRRDMTPEQSLNVVCDRITGGLANAGVKARRMDAADIQDWLLRWFNPHPSMLGETFSDRERFYRLRVIPPKLKKARSNWLPALILHSTCSLSNPARK